MVTRLIWTIWTPMSPVPKKADKLNLSLSLEGWGTGIESLRQSGLLHFLVLLEALCYACCRVHGVHKRRLVKHETLSVTSLSPRSRRDALGALQDLAGLTLNVPLDEVMAWRNSWYCAAETFLCDPSSSSSSEKELSFTFSSVSRAAEKSTGEASLGADLEDEGLLMGDRERVESLDSSIPLERLTEVLERLTGVLEHLTGVLERLTGVLECSTGVLDPLGRVWSSLVVGVWSTGLDWVSGTGIPKSILRCSIVTIDIKLSKLAWLILLGGDGKIKLLTSETMDVSWTAAGVVPAGVPWATGSSPLAESSNAESCGCVGTCWVLFLCRVGNTCRVVHTLGHVIRCRAVIPCWLIAC